MSGENRTFRDVKTLWALYYWRKLLNYSIQTESSGVEIKVLPACKTTQIQVLKTFRKN